MKKIIIAILMVMFSFNIAEARPMNNHRYNHRRPAKQVVVKHKSSRGDKIAVGLLAGLTGIIIGDRIINGGSYGSPSVSNTYYYDTAPRSSRHCVTTVSGYGGATTTTCSSQPQTNEVIYIN